MQGPRCIALVHQIGSWNVSQGVSREATESHVKQPEIQDGNSTAGNHFQTE